MGGGRKASTGQPSGVHAFLRGALSIALLLGVVAAVLVTVPLERLPAQASPGAGFAPVMSTSFGAISAYPAVVASGDGVYHSVVREDGLVQRIVYRQSRDGGRTWVVAKRFNGEAAGVTRPSIAVSGSRVAIAFIGNWCEFAGQCPDAPFLVSSTDGGGTWLGPVRLDRQAFDVGVAVDGSRTWVTWDRGGSVEVRGTSDGASTYFAKKSFTGANPFVAAADGRAVVAWTTGAGAGSPRAVVAVNGVVGTEQNLGGAETTLGSWSAPVAAADGRVHVLLKNGKEIEVATADATFGSPISVTASGYSAAIAARRGVVAITTADRDGVTWVATSNNRATTFSPPVPVATTPGGEPLVEIGVATTTPDRPVARFSWSVDPRYKSTPSALRVSANAAGAPWLATPDMIVHLNGCFSLAPAGRTIGTNSYRWTVDDTELAETTCEVDLPTLDDKVSRIRLEVTDNANIRGSVAQNVQPRDLLVVSIGDSIASGEGNPHTDGIATYPNQTYETWEDAACHRSARSGPALAAAQLEDADPHSSVTFVHLACSGASIMDVPAAAGTAPSGPDGPETGGLLDMYHGIEPEGRPARPSQLAQLQALIGQRRVDALLLSIGANDIKFSEVVKECIVSRPSDPRPCHRSGTSDRVALRLGTLSQRYDALATALDGMGITGDRVHISEYFDVTTDELGQENLRCIVNSQALGEFAGYLSDLAGAALVVDPDPATKTILEVIDFVAKVVAGALDGGLVTDDETAWARSTVVAGLNQAVSDAAASHGWKYVGGIASAFEGHGYCSTDSWVVRIGQSVATQLDEYGAVHPNRQGQVVYGDTLFRSLRTQFLVPATAGAGVPAGPDAIGDIYVVTATRTTINASVIRDTGITPVLLRNRQLDRFTGGEGYLGPGGRPAADEASAVGAWTEVDASNGAWPAVRAAQIVVGENASVRRVAIVQAPADGVRIVAGRTSVVLATVDAQLAEPQTVDVTTEVQATDSGGAQRTLVAPVTTPVRLVPGRNDLLLPVSATFVANEHDAIDATVSVVDPLGADPSYDFDNVGQTSQTQPAIAVTTRPLKMIFVSAAVPNAGPVGCAGVGRAAERMATYVEDAVPVSDAGVLSGIACTEVPVTAQSEPGTLELLADLDRLARLGGVDAIVAVVPDGWLQAAADGAVGAAATGLRGIIVESSAPSLVLAHEYAHTVGVEHTDRIPASGANLRTRQTPSGIDWMNYAAVTRTWTGGVTWEKLISGIGGPLSTPTVPNPQLPGVWVRGTVTQNPNTLKWTVSPAVWTPTQTGQPPAEGLGELELERLVIRQVNTQGQPVGVTQPVSLGETGGLYSSGTASEPPPIGLMFAAPVQLDPATTAIQLYLDGQLVETRPVNAAPLVEVTAPALGTTVARGGDLTVDWAASDPDGDSLTTDLLVSDDAGVTWEPLASDVTGTTHTGNVPADLDGTDIRVRVVVSDGVRTAWDDSDPFTVDGGGSGGVLQERIVFHRDSSFSGPVGGSRLWTMNPDGTDVVEMALPLRTVYPPPSTRCDYLGDCNISYRKPSWGPDGRVYFSSNLQMPQFDGDDAGTYESGERIFSSLPDGSDLQRITPPMSIGAYWGTNQFGQSLGGYSNTCAMVSPDNQELSWIGYETNGGVNVPRLWVARRIGDGWGPPSVILTAGTQSALTLHSSFSSPLDGQPTLSFTPESQNGCPRWSPDSGSLVFVASSLSYRPQGEPFALDEATPVVSVRADGSGLRVVSPDQPFVQGTGAYANFKWQTEWNMSADWDADGSIVVHRGFENVATLNTASGSGSSPKTYGIRRLDPLTGTFSAIMPTSVSYTVNDLWPGDHLKVAPDGSFYGMGQNSLPLPCGGRMLQSVDPSSGGLTTVAAADTPCIGADSQFDWAATPGAGGPPVEVVAISPTPPAAPNDAGGPYSAMRDEPITLDAGASARLAGPGGAIATVTWDLDGDGQFDDAIGIRPTVSFPDAGTFPLRVRIDAADGTGVSDPVDVVVSDSPVAPPTLPAPGADDPLGPLPVPIDVDITIPAGVVTTAGMLPPGTFARVVIVTPPDPAELSITSPNPAGVADRDVPTLVSDPSGAFVLSPAAGFRGTTSFRIAVLGAPDVTAVVTVRVVGNEPPSTVEDRLTVRAGVASVVAASLLTGNDVDPDGGPDGTLKLASVSGSTNGDAWLDPQGLVHVVATTPGTGTVRYVVADDQGAVASGTLALTVEAQSEPPTPTTSPTTLPPSTTPTSTTPTATIPGTWVSPDGATGFGTPARDTVEPTGELPATGTDPNRPLSIALSLGLCGLVLVLVSRRRRDRTRIESPLARRDRL